MASPSETISNCRLGKMFYHDDATGFTIGVYSHPTSGSFTALGNIISPVIGQTYELCDGTWKDNNYKGRVTKQFHFRLYKTEKPKDIHGIYRFIVKTKSLLGPKTAEKVIELYGTESLDILRKEPDRVANEINGITISKATTIAETLSEIEDEEQALVSLDSLFSKVEGLPKNISVLCLKKFGYNAYDEIVRNPYCLVEIDRVGFPTADRVALGSLDMKKDSMFRIVAALTYIHKQERNGNGHIWIDREFLELKTKRLLEIDGELVGNGVEESLENGIFVLNEGCVAFKDDSMGEFFIAEKIKALLEAKVVARKVDGEGENGSEDGSEGEDYQDQISDEEGKRLRDDFTNWVKSSSKRGR